MRPRAHPNSSPHSPDPNWMACVLGWGSPSTPVNVACGPPVTLVARSPQRPDRGRSSATGLAAYVAQGRGPSHKVRKPFGTGHPGQGRRCLPPAPTQLCTQPRGAGVQGRRGDGPRGTRREETCQVAGGLHKLSRGTGAVEPGGHLRVHTPGGGAAVGQPLGDSLRTTWPWAPRHGSPGRGPCTAQEGVRVCSMLDGSRPRAPGAWSAPCQSEPGDGPTPARRWGPSTRLPSPTTPFPFPPVFLTTGRAMAIRDPQACT